MVGRAMVGVANDGRRWNLKCVVLCNRGWDGGDGNGGELILLHNGGWLQGLILSHDCTAVVVCKGREAVSWCLHEVRYCTYNHNSHNTVHRVTWELCAVLNRGQFPVDIFPMGRGFSFKFSRYFNLFWVIRFSKINNLLLLNINTICY